MRQQNKWIVVLHKEEYNVIIDSFKTKKQAEDYLQTRKELTQHLIGDGDIYSVELSK